MTVKPPHPESVAAFRGKWVAVVAVTTGVRVPFLPTPPFLFYGLTVRSSLGADARNRESPTKIEGEKTSLLRLAPSNVLLPHPIR